MDKEIYELEANLLGAMILDHKRFKKAQDEGLLPEDFETYSYRKAYEVMLDTQASDIVTIRNKIEDDFTFNEIREAAGYCISPAGFAHWIKAMHEKTANNKLLRLAAEIPDIVKTDDPIDKKVDQVNQLIINNKVTKNTGSPVEVKDVLQKVKDELKNTDLLSQSLIKTGFQNIDQRIKGFKDGDLIIVAGRPGMGKTTWALNIATNNILAGKTVLVFSLEMTNEQLIKKIISSESDLGMDKLLTGNLTADQWDKFNTIEQRLSETNLYVYDKSPITIETLINKTKAIQAIKNIDLIVVDYLQLLMTSNKAPSNSDSRAASMTYISNLLKGLAKDVGCPLISLSQLNRGVEARTDKRPVLSDLRDSGSIEQDADMVIMLYRQEYYDSLDTSLAEVIIRKNRLGETGEFELAFDGARSKFLDPEEVAFGERKKQRTEYGPI
jgi:replicative DNA helicase